MVIFWIASVAVEEDVRAVRALAGLVRLRVDERRRVACRRPSGRRLGPGAARDRPDPLVAVARSSRRALTTSRCEHFVVGRQDVFLRHVAIWSGLTLRGLPRMNVRNARSPYVAKPSVDAIAVEPVKVLVDDRLPQRREVAARGVGLRRAEQFAVDDLRDLPVALGVEVDRR